MTIILHKDVDVENG